MCDNAPNYMPFFAKIINGYRKSRQTDQKSRKQNNRGAAALVPTAPYFI